MPPENDCVGMNATGCIKGLNRLACVVQLYMPCKHKHKIKHKCASLYLCSLMSNAFSNKGEGKAGWLQEKCSCALR